MPQSPAVFLDSCYAGIDSLRKNKGGIVGGFCEDSCVQLFGGGRGAGAWGVCPGCPGSFMSSYTGPLLLPRGAPVSVAGRQPFNDLQRRLSQCGQVRALCIITHRSPRTTDRFPQPQPATLKVLRLRPGPNAASCT